MSSSDLVPHPPPAAPPVSIRKESVSAKIAELNESRSELQTRIQSLKQDLQSWRSKLDTQVKIYRDELADLKKSLNVDVEQLRSEFQELRTTLQQQQQDVTTSLRSLGLQDVPGDTKDLKSIKVEEETTGEAAEAAVDHVVPLKVDDVKPQIY